MKIASHQGRALLYTDRGWIDIAKASRGRFGPSMAEVLDNWLRFCSWADTATLESEKTVDPAGPWDPVSPQARQVIAIGANYAEHAAEMTLPDDDLIVAFSKFPTCLTGHHSQVRLPSSTVDWEVELVVVIGVQGQDIPVERAWEHVAGLTIGQDLTDRHLQTQRPGRQFSLAKSFPGAGPVGPYLVTPLALDNPDDLAIGCAVNGRTVQAARTSDMRRSIPDIVAELSRHLRLLPGDLIFTGSPSGSGHGRTPRQYLHEGTLDSWIEGIGTLTVTLTNPC